MEEKKMIEELNSIKKAIKDAFTDFIEDLESDNIDNSNLEDGQVVDSTGNVITLDPNKSDLKEK